MGGAARARAAVRPRARLVGLWVERIDCGGLRAAAAGQGEGQADVAISAVVPRPLVPVPLDELAAGSCERRGLSLHVGNKSVEMLRQQGLGR